MNVLTKELSANFSQDVDQIMNQSFLAQKTLEKLDDERVDQLITDIANIFGQDLEYWATEELRYTEIGNVTDKIHKLDLVTDRVYRELYGTKTYGRLSGSQPLIEFASPVGVIFGIVPLTNPVPNSLFKTLLSLKTRNSLILSYPRKAQEFGQKVVETIQGVLRKYDLPVELIQAIQSPSREATRMVMQSDQVSLILATGGSDLVKTAYSSGTPAIGVGPGNVPVFVSSTADLKQAAESIIAGKTYDNGIVCGSESNLIVDENIYDEFVAMLQASGATVIDDDAALDEMVDHLFDEKSGRLNREMIGVTAAELVEKTTLSSQKDPIKLLVLKSNPEKYPFLSREKMAPVLTLFKAKANEGIKLSSELLWQEGAGHTAVIHSHDQGEIQAFAELLPAGRILVNMSATHGMLGINSDLPLSFMQGSGSWGGNISTEPVHWRHLVNIKRLSFRK